MLRVNIKAKILVQEKHTLQYILQNYYNDIILQVLSSYLLVPNIKA